MLWLFVGPTRVYLLDFFCSGIQFFQLNLSSWCLVMVERLFLAVPRGCLQFVSVVFPDHTHLLFFLFSVESLSLLYLLFISMF